MELHERRHSASVLADNPLSELGKSHFGEHLIRIQTVCADYGFNHTSNMAKRAGERTAKFNRDVFAALSSLHDSLSHELDAEAVVRIPSERKPYYEVDAAFGAEVAEAFPSCTRDIRRAATCYALGQEDACVHHLMLTLERGLNAVAIKMEVPYQQTNWQPIIDGIGSKLRGTSRSPERDFYREINTQFGLLKDAYRNHSQHARDNPYDMPKALHIFNHVREFMQQLASRCDEEGNPRPAAP
jgi:hypothetical protein